MNRQRMIEQLVNAATEAILTDPALDALKNLLERGFGGYRQMSDTALRREMQLRGLLDFDEPERDDTEFDDDDEDDDEEGLRMKAWDTLSSDEAAHIH